MRGHRGPTEAGSMPAAPCLPPAASSHSQGRVCWEVWAVGRGSAELKAARQGHCTPSIGSRGAPTEACTRRRGDTGGSWGDLEHPAVTSGGAPSRVPDPPEHPRAGAGELQPSRAPVRRRGQQEQAGAGIHTGAWGSLQQSTRLCPDRGLTPGPSARLSLLHTSNSSSSALSQ